jgi:outer membrane receptor protein involved in Fe transport
MPTENRFTWGSKARGWSILVVLLAALATEGVAQTTGKLSGKIVDGKSGDPLIAVNVMIVGTNLGAVTDLAGEYYILNIPPGTYRLRATLVGYEPVVMQSLVVSVNRTTVADFKLSERVIEGQEVVVTAPLIEQRKDQTSSIRNVTSDQIKALPVENVDQVVALQAGVVRGHFRGGRADEVAYLLNGVRVQDAYGLGRSVNVENDAISEVEVITGTFNAEYGNAMSGIVNNVTKDGGNEFRGSGSISASNFATPHTYNFTGLTVSRLQDVTRSKDYKVYLEGPIIRDGLSFLVNGRYQDNVGARNGIRRFMPDNYSNWPAADPASWHSDHTGDNAVVPMDYNTTATAYGKLSLNPLQEIRASVDYTYNYYKGKSYNHFYKFNPEGVPTNYSTSQLLSAKLNHTLSSSLFYEASASYIKNWNAYYLFENPMQTLKNTAGGDIINRVGLPVYAYVSDQYAAQTSYNPGFSTGGQDKSWSQNWIEDYNLKIDGTWQATKQHTIKSGFDYTKHGIHRFNTTVQNSYGSDESRSYDDSVTGMRTYLYYKPSLPTAITSGADIYVVKPLEYSAYVQDKMEFDYMVINVGLRFDCFIPNASYPSEPRNPSNALTYPDNPEKMSVYLTAPAKRQLSPRFGISYKLAETALLRFSYGHFFQMPPLYALYTDYWHTVLGDYQTVMGNPLLKPQKTIQYEAGLWQQLNPNMSCEVAVFYRDIYDLLSAVTVQTFNAIHYGLYSNKDYGNARGLELKYDYVAGDFSASVNYTLQYTRGNANSPTFTFTREGGKLDPVNLLIPMDWDQRHTLNASLAYAHKGYGGSITGHFDSGTPYGWTPLTQSQQALVTPQPNDATRPTLFSVDLNAYVNLWSIGPARTRLTLLVYNLFDALNETAVNTTTGRANQQILLPTDIAKYTSNFSTIYDWMNDPNSYTNPRSVKVGFEVMF